MEKESRELWQILWQEPAELQQEGLLEMQIFCTHPLLGPLKCCISAVPIDLIYSEQFPNHSQVRDPHSQLTSQNGSIS